MEQFVTVTHTKDGVDYEMLEARYAPKGPASGRLWYLCTICGGYFPEDEVRLKGGQAFCVPRRCYESMDSDRSCGKV
jgi:formylmethanofuran dehydrogenase subunit E